MLATTYLHSGWEFAEKNWPGGKVATVDTGWHPATVPGHVHLDLVENGIIAHPFERMNELGCQWVDQSDWSYRTAFHWAPQEDLPTRVLRFEGLDTVCEVFLNDEKIADHDNMFVPLEIDVSEKLIHGENVLRIEFKSAIRVGQERRGQYFEQEGIKPDTLNFDERSFVRKAQYMYGWDWGPRLVSCGIWQPVSLLEFKARVKDLHVAQDHQPDGSVILNVTAEIDGQGAISFSLIRDDMDLQIEPDHADGHSASFVIEDPTYWYPRTDEYALTDGPDVAYRIIADVTDDDGSISDLEFVDIGIVKTVLLREPDEFGESFEFEVNGQKIWARGANWIPDHSFPSIVSESRYRDRLEKAKDMGFNMLRVWGGGLYETDEFYDLCDELGILVWQDFPFACAYYPDDELWQEVIRKEATANIKRIRNHPCLALWCGNNENLEMHVNTWGGPERHPSRYYGANHYDGVLPALVSELNPNIAYIATSPIGDNPNNDGKAAKQTGPNSGGFGDQHCWDVWHGRGDWKYYADSTGRFSSEYGFASSCSTALWSKTLDDADWDPHSTVVKWHDRTAKGHETFHGYVKLHYPTPVTLEDWVYYSQLNQRDALRCGVEHYRRSVFCRGSLIWQFNDCWPVQSWAIMDSEGDYKALGYELRRLYADTLLSLARDNDKVTLWAINDGPEVYEEDLILQAVHVQTGEVLHSWFGSARVEPNSRIPVLEASIAGLATPDVLLWTGDIGSSQPSWMLLSEPKSARFGPAEPLIVSTCQDGALIIKSSAPLVDLMLTDDGSPAPFKDNFLTVPYADTFAVRINRMPESIEARSLAGVHPVKLTRSPL